MSSKHRDGKEMSSDVQDQNTLWNHLWWNLHWRFLVPFWLFASKFWEVSGTYERYSFILSMQVEWRGQQEVVGKLKPYLLLRLRLRLLALKTNLVKLNCFTRRISTYLLRCHSTNGSKISFIKNGSSECLMQTIKQLSVCVVMLITTGCRFA